MPSSVLELGPGIPDNPEAFPLLDPADRESLAEIAKTRHFEDGQTLWRIGERHGSFYVVIDGAVDILQRRPRGDEALIVRHGPGGFTGDPDLLSDNAAVVEGRARGETEVLEVCPETLKKVVAVNSRLSDTILGAFLARRRALLAGGFGATLLLGSRFSPETFRIREFLERNSRPFTWLDLEADDAAAALLAGFGLSPADTPVVADASGFVLRNPSLQDLADAMGLSVVAEDRLYDVIVVGAGPAGLAASVYASSEGLDVVTVDAIAPGGQASTSSKIENYLGFPTGISGPDLAQRAFVQAEKFGTTIAVPRRAASLDCSCPVSFTIGLEDGSKLRGRSVVIASGAQYRRLPVPGTERFEGRGVYFGATAMEARMCAGEEVVIVGGGNSAGQAAVFLAAHARHVHIAIRSESLDHSMSRYLIHRIDALPNVSLHPFTEVAETRGEDELTGVSLVDRKSGKRDDYDCRNLFVFIGAQPNTEWLGECVSLDERGFVKTGRDIAPEELSPERWGANRQPYLLETSRPGIFAVGDVRSGSTKRVASAVGEGSIAVQFVHAFLGGAA